MIWKQTAMHCLKSVSAFLIFLTTLITIPIGNLNIHSGFTLEEHLALFLMPAALLALTASLIPFKSNTAVHFIWAVLAGACMGLAVASVLLGLATAYFWYQTPGNFYLMTLVIVLALAAVVAGTVDRHLAAAIRQHAND